jgi:hypothetical protein
MWTSLSPGERVQAGDIIRFRPGLSQLAAPRDMLYDVIKADQHYFEVAVRADDEDDGKRDLKIIKYMDIGYHLIIEIWSGKSPTKIIQ